MNISIRSVMLKFAVTAGAMASIGIGTASSASAGGGNDPTFGVSREIYGTKQADPEVVVKPRAGCGGVYNPKTPGAKAHWTLKCKNGRITVEGWVEDTDNDGQCAQVKAVFNGPINEYSTPACPKGERQSFKWSHPGTIADVYLYEYDA